MYGRDEFVHSTSVGRASGQNVMIRRLFAVLTPHKCSASDPEIERKLMLKYEILRIILWYENDRKTAKCYHEEKAAVMNSINSRK
jgi:hypothetical protein